MKESEVSLPSTAGWQLVVNLPSIVDRVVSDLQQQHDRGASTSCRR